MLTEIYNKITKDFTVSFDGIFNNILGHISYGQPLVVPNDCSKVLMIMHNYGTPLDVKVTVIHPARTVAIARSNVYSKEGYNTSMRVRLAIISNLSAGDKIELTDSYSAALLMKI